MKPSLATVLTAAAISIIAFACGAPETTGNANSEVNGKNGKKPADGDKEKADPKTDTTATTPKSDAGTGDDDPGMKCMLDCVGNDPQLRETLTCTDKCIPASKRDKVDDSKAGSSDKEEEIELTPQEEACFTDCFDKEDKLCESAPSSCTKLDQCGQKCFPDAQSGSSDDTGNGGAGDGPNR